MTKKRIYIRSAAHISAQQPLSEEWLNNPIHHQDEQVLAIDLNYKDYLPANTARRAGKIIKRALVCSRVALERANVEMPDGIITATGLGCINDTEIFLDKMSREGETLLAPTHFMQSTHNSIGSAVALDLKCHAYNIHYSHKSVSFDCALQDALIQLQNSKRENILLGGYDELSPIFSKIMRRLPSRHFPNGGFEGETAVSMLLSNKKENNRLCCIEDVQMNYKTDLQKMWIDFLDRNHLTMEDIDLVFTGVNGNEENDFVYRQTVQSLFPSKPLARYKHLFGENFTSSGLGIYAAATCLQKQYVPEHLRYGENQKIDSVKRVLFYNHSENKEHTFVLMTNE